MIRAAKVIGAVMLCAPLLLAGLVLTTVGDALGSAGFLLWKVMIK